MTEGETRSWHGNEGLAVPPGDNGIGGVFTHGGKYVQYSIFGNLFDVTARYRPPIRPISRGAYGIVCSALDSETGEEVAIKKISNVFQNPLIAKRSLREIKILRHMDHENILSFKEVILPPRRENFSDVYIVTELMDTDLANIIRQSEDVTEEHYQFFLYQLLKGLKYIHSANVLHRDLKPSNLLIDEDCQLKIADFGLSRTFSETDQMTEYVITRWYRPPELLFKSRHYTSAIDIWSVGCILAEMYNREPLFPGKDHLHQIRTITQLLGCPSDSELGYEISENSRKYVEQQPRYQRQPLAERFPKLPLLAIDLIEKMLVYDPTKRITAEEALSHPYLAHFHEPTDEPNCPTPFTLGFDEQSLSVQDIKDLIYEQACYTSQSSGCFVEEQY